MKVKELLSSKDKWIKRNFALDEKGNHTYCENKEAAKFCLFGALMHCYRNILDRKLVGDKLDLAIRTYTKGKYCKAGQSMLTNKKYKGVFSFNDKKTTTFKDIKKVLEIADI